MESHVKFSLHQHLHAGKSEAVEANGLYKVPYFITHDWPRQLKVFQGIQEMAINSLPKQQLAA